MPSEFPGEAPSGGVRREDRGGPSPSSKRPKRDLSEVDLGAFGLEEDPAFARPGAVGLDHLRPVHPVRDAIPTTLQFQGIPIPARTLEVFLAPKAQDIVPLGRTLFPIDASSDDALAVVRTHLLLRLREAALQRGVEVDACMVDKQQVPRAALDNLELEGSWPHLIGALHVEKDAAVAGLLLSRRPSALAPLEFSSKDVVLVFPLGGEIAEFLAADVNHAVEHLKDMVGIVVSSGVPQVGVETGEVPAVPEFLLGGCGGDQDPRRQGPCQKRAKEPHTDLLSLS